MLDASSGERKCTVRILYVFSHPDDESYGPARAISKQRREGHEVHLLTLTRGGATRQRHKYGYSIDEMGEVRYQEMKCVEKVLDLTGMTVLDLPDSGLKHMDPRIIEQAVSEGIAQVEPDTVVTYAVHGISGFHDHLATHAVVKRAYVALADKVDYLKRLAFYTITAEEAGHSSHFHLSGSEPSEIDVVIAADAVDLERNQKALDCYRTYQDAIDQSGIREMLNEDVVFEIFGEEHDPPLNDLCGDL
jgi:LmbE family N-acetylglucosaminyl deacetylase